MKKLIFVLLLSTAALYSFSSVTLAETSKSKLSQVQTTRVNLNTASLEQLVTLPGIGKKKAAAIIEYRTQNGKFKTVEELTNVKGVGSKMIEKLKGQLKVS